MGDTGARNYSQGRATLKKKLTRLSRQSKVALTQPPVPLNTYQLKPKYPFHPQPVYNILLQKTPPVFEKIYEYSFDDLAALCKYLNVELLRTLNCLYWPSYKIVVVVQCLEKADNSARGSVRYYWNPRFDGLVTYTHDTTNYYVVATAAFFYYE